ncbi:hypothetical protein [Psychromonas sp. Urea-02u-13]|uniref:hypothetical protein n=1 Tax=Psychromonas sp. Urea-02u-13 TaxID=2058326 RepID=UPI000C33E850|nr:hypothetical protein [Psychromonas sp. Urea-02u-13]PKG40304.1 hypothetical protein CXF74_04355 [Psychromonas sp. Urea-02u-13]
MHLIIRVLILFILSASTLANTLQVGKICAVVNANNNQLGLLVLSDFWFHSGRNNAAYTATDNATGIGVEIHFFSNQAGQLSHRNLGQCNKYRVLQVRKTNSQLNAGEHPIQVDIPAYFEQPFYDNSPLEFGYKTHKTPIDNSDKPWFSRAVRASTIGIYDTPYVSDAYGIDGQDIRVEFETCIVCQRYQGFDQLLSCATWGYQRDYLNEETGWTEPDILTPQCLAHASEQFKNTLETSLIVDYQYWLDWR